MKHRKYRSFILYRYSMRPVKQESRAVACKPRDAAIIFMPLFAECVHAWATFPPLTVGNSFQFFLMVSERRMFRAIRCWVIIAGFPYRSFGRNLWIFPYRWVADIGSEEWKPELIIRVMNFEWCSRVLLVRVRVRVAKNNDCRFDAGL